MNIQMKSLKIMLRLWSLMLAVSLISLQLTAALEIEIHTPTAVSVSAKSTPSPASESSLIESELKVLRIQATSSTIQLRLQNDDDNDADDFGSKEKLLTTTTKQLPRTGGDETLEMTKTFSSTGFPTSSYILTTLASSNAPFTITNQAKLELNNEEQQGKRIEEETTTKQYKSNDKLEIEIKKADSNQVTESVLKQQQQKNNQLQQQYQHQHQPEHITTEVNWQKETDMHKQSQGNARNSEQEIKIITTIATQTHTPTPTTVTSSTARDIEPHDTTSSSSFAFTHNANNDENAAVASTSPTEQYTTDHVEHQEIAGDDVKPVVDDTTTITLTLARERQAEEDFKPIIKDVNDKLLKERTIFSSKADISNEEWKQNLMPNELEYNKPLMTKSLKHNINWSPYLHPATPVSDFTGKLLQEQDGVITEIEQKFRLNEFENVDEAKTTKNPKLSTQKTSLELTQTTTFSKASQPTTSHSVNHEILNINRNPTLNRPPGEFIERRVKKSFDFPMHRMASDSQHLQQHFDFANTKFSSNNNEPHSTQDSNLNSGDKTKENASPSRPQPEFSTTKFYNSKELYNEMLLHKTKLQQQSLHAPNIHEKDIEELNNRAPSLALNSFAVLHSPKIAKLEEIHELKEPQQKSLAIKKVTVKATKHKYLADLKEESATMTTTSTTTTSTKKPNTTTSPTKGFSSPAVVVETEMPLAALVKTKKFQKELKRAKLLIKSMMPLQNTTTETTSISNNYNNDKTTIATVPLKTPTPVQTKTTSRTADNLLLSSPLSHDTPTSTTSRPAVSSQNPSAASSSPTSNSLQLFSGTSTNSPKTSLHPIVRPRILSRLQEKINSLECELQNLPQDSHLWRGNETHELLLPIMICKPYWTPITWFANNRWVLRNSRNCTTASDTPENCKTDKDCTAMMVSWEGEAEIQSGDILIVEVNDALLTPKDINLTTSAHNTQVYQVTRSGHEHCDVTEGILLDITPLIVDGRKLVTLYDKDLTEGVNLLIVVSELWGSQCVRLKVTTKTENCGENADCSGKGICYSNYDMEEYECQCCSGFAGPHCEEIDACTPSPCTNNGICVDLSQGHEGNSYQCLCPYGYTGKNCQYELDPCNPAECMNGGSCVGNSTHFRCECTPGYTGPLCQHSLNECESSPCIHGICVDQEDGFRCFCQPGFAGELCNFEYNECESNPCQNGGECIDHIGSYECHCSKGYTGNRCQMKVDFCANKPCPDGRRCIDHGNDYSCECLGGRNGPDCNEMQRTQCNVNPCTHGGTCWSSGDSFYCACRPGYTGTMCEDEFVVETVVSSSEFMVDDTSARNFNDKSFGSSVVLKSPIELHNAYTAAIVLALVIFFVALYLTICHCKVNQTYRKFSTRTYGFLPILGFRLRTKQATSKISRHWLSGKGLGIGNAMRAGVGVGGATTSSSSTSALHATTATSSHRNSVGHLPTAKASSGTQQHTHVGQLNERPFQRHLAMNLENDMYYTVDFSENSQHSPLIQ